MSSSNKMLLPYGHSVGSTVIRWRGWEVGGGGIILVKGNFKDFLCSKLCYVFALKLVVATSVADPYNFETDLIII